MKFAKIVLGIMVTIFIFAGCGSNPKDPPDLIGDETLHEIRFGTSTFHPEETNLVAYGKENQITFQFLKSISPKNVTETFGMNAFISNRTQGWTNIISTYDVWNNGSISIVDNEFGSVVYYNASHPLDMMLEPAGCSGFVERYHIYPGDEILIDVGFFTFEYADTEPFLLFTDNYRTCCSADIFTRSVGADDIDTEGFIESFKIGSYEISDEHINLIPLGNMNDITIDFNCQINPYKFADLIDFKIVLNNQFSDISYSIDTDTMFQNGEIYVVDYVEGIVRFVMDHPMSYFMMENEMIYAALPGDLIEVWIDFFEAEDSQESEFIFQNKKFQIFYLGSQTVG